MKEKGKMIERGEAYQGMRADYFRKKIIHDLQYVEACFSRKQIENAIRRIKRPPDDWDLTERTVHRRMILNRMHEQGYNFSEIARRMRMSRTGVETAIKTYRREILLNQRWNRLIDAVATI
jgi:hypothetical protein